MNNIEISKVIDLSSLLSCDLAQAWAFLKDEIQSNIGKNKLVCIPYLIAEGLYNITSVFIKTAQTGPRGKRNRTYTPIGRIEHILLESSIQASWHNILTKISAPDTQKFPKSFSLKLSDKENKKEVIFKAKDLYREHFPKECTAVGNIKIDKSKIPELASANTIYFVNDIIGAREIELRIKVGQNNQEYLFTSQPLVFGYEKYLLNKDACIIRKMTNAVSSKRTSWTAVK